MVAQNMTCFFPCPEPEVLQIPENNWQVPGQGGGGGSFTLFTADSDSIELSGAGTNGDPLTAQFINGQTIEFEMAFGSQTGLTDGQLVGTYVPTKQITIPGGLPNLGVVVRDQVSDIELDLFKNDTQIGTITIVNGAVTVSFNSAVTLVANDNLRVLSGAVSEFSELGLTIRALRTLDFVP